MNPVLSLKSVLFLVYTYRFPDRKLPPSLVDALKKPTFATRLGGGTTVLAGR